MKQFYYTYNKSNKNINLKQYIYTIGSYHYNWHNDLELLLIMNGKVEVCTNGTSRNFETDDMILINSNIGHATLAQKPNSIAMVLHIDPMFFKEYYENVGLLYFNLNSSKKTRNEKQFVLIRSYLSQMILCCNKESPEHKLLFESLFYSLIYTIISYFPPKEVYSAAFMTNQKKFNAINRMIKYIDKNYKKKITLDKLSKVSGYNSNYVSQLFKSHLGINFYSYLTRIRLREATHELSQSRNKILEIALDNGFPDIKAFNSAFRENFGKSPTEYRCQLNSENIKNDINFKKQFISIENKLINNKLIGYVSNKDSYYLKNSSLNWEKINKLTECMTEPLHKLQELTKELVQTTDCFEKNIKDLPK
ncbi:helix-turn-helix transcriptional regulator [Clostridium sp. HV4-5-A1G]|uniref:helix-turn-helix transcriptional regulator n=3 Tax=Clostridium sp. HV4-5-A1G TaxID=2004595 RepID=UPI00123BCC8C|nr:AraC family transcriptional regulator [Clostridium sp. HV4-5-A1G]KAA8666391.1 helix-turn-helix transcriptional regulator [Clostridium sp. HV4-5-A1G]